MGISKDTGAAQPTRQPYRCFLLRCWLQEGAGLDGEPGWRFTVQEAGPDAPRRAFACLKDVEAYLEATLGPAGQGAAG